MKKLSATLLSFILLFLPFLIFSQSDDSVFIRQVANNILSSKAAYNNLHYLTKNIGGRLAGSSQMVMAEQWGKNALQQAGADDVILQECMVPHWVRGGKDKATLFYSDAKNKAQQRSLAVLALGNSVGTGMQGIKAPLFRVNSFDDLEQHKADIKDKIVFYNVPFDDTLIETFHAYGKNVVYRGIGASRAVVYGAKAVVVRSMTNSVDNNPHTGALRYTDSTKKIPAAALGLHDVAFLDTLFDEGKSLQLQLITNAKMLPDTIGHNVIGVLTGSEHPEQIITVGGHLDSWDVNEGATDDGAGIVQTMEILRAFKALGFKPKHTIHFVLFANEENGTRGANKYASAAKEKNEQHIFALESDAGGFTPRGFFINGSDTLVQKLSSYKNLFEPYGVYKFIKGEAGTDVTPIHETFGAPVSELSPDSQRYFDVHHSAGDVLEAVNIRELKLGAINMAALLYVIDKYNP